MFRLALYCLISISVLAASFQGATAQPLSSITSFPVGSKPGGMVFDGTNIWVANGGSNNIMERV
jgi:DNA-binding beta-propeller fold protein YncE